MWKSAARRMLPLEAHQDRPGNISVISNGLLMFVAQEDMVTAGQTGSAKWEQCLWEHHDALCMRTLAENAFVVPVSELRGVLMNQADAVSSDRDGFAAKWKQLEHNYGLYSSNPAPRIPGHRYMVLPRVHYKGPSGSSVVHDPGRPPIPPASIGIQLINFTGRLEVFAAESVHGFMAKTPAASSSRSTHNVKPVPRKLTTMGYTDSAFPEVWLSMFGMEVTPMKQPLPEVFYAMEVPGCSKGYNSMEGTLCTEHSDSVGGSVEIKIRSGSYTMVAEAVTGVFFIKLHDYLSSINATPSATNAGELNVYGQYDVAHPDLERAQARIPVGESSPHPPFVTRTEEQLSFLGLGPRASITQLTDLMVRHMRRPSSDTGLVPSLQNADAIDAHAASVTRLALQKHVRVHCKHGGHVTIMDTQLLVMRPLPGGVPHRFVLFAADMKLMDVLPIGILGFHPQPWVPGTAPYTLEPYIPETMELAVYLFGLINEPDVVTRLHALDVIYGPAATSLSALDPLLSEQLGMHAAMPIDPIVGNGLDPMVVDTGATTSLGTLAGSDGETTTSMSVAHYVPPHAEPMVDDYNDEHPSDEVIEEGMLAPADPTSGPTGEHEEEEEAPLVEFTFDPSALHGIGIPIETAVPASKKRTRAHASVSDEAEVEEGGDEVEEKEEEAEVEDHENVTSVETAVKKPKRIRKRGVSARHSRSIAAADAERIGLVDVAPPRPSSLFDATKRLVDEYAEAAVQQLINPTGRFASLGAIDFVDDATRSLAVVIAQLPPPNLPGRPPGVLNGEISKEALERRIKLKMVRQSTRSKRNNLLLDLADRFEANTPRETITEIGQKARILFEEQAQEVAQERARMRLAKRIENGRTQPYKNNKGKGKGKRQKLVNGDIATGTQPQAPPATSFATSLGLGDPTALAEELALTPDHAQDGISEFSGYAPQPADLGEYTGYNDLSGAGAIFAEDFEGFDELAIPSMHTHHDMPLPVSDIHAPNDWEM